MKKILSIVAVVLVAFAVWPDAYQTLTVFDYSAGTGAGGSGVPTSTQAYGGFMYAYAGDTAISNQFDGQWLPQRNELTNSRVIPVSSVGAEFGYRMQGTNHSFTLSGAALTNMNLRFYLAGTANLYYTNPILPEVMITNRLSSTWWVTNYLTMAADGLWYTFSSAVGGPYPGMTMVSWLTNLSATNYLAGPTGVVWNGYAYATNIILPVFRSYDGSNWENFFTWSVTNPVSTSADSYSGFYVCPTNFTLSDRGYIRFTPTNPGPNNITQMFLHLYHK